MIYAILLILFGTFLGEQAAIRIKKYKELGLFQKSILILFFQSMISLVFGFIFNAFYFKLTIVSFILAISLIFLALGFQYFTMKAIQVADRSTAAIFSILVLPMLLISDIILGYEINIYQIIGVLFISVVLLISSYSGTLNLKGFKYIISTTIIAFLSTVIFKYQITYYTSVYSQLFIHSFFSMLVLLFVVYKKERIDGIKIILNKNYLLIGFMRGLNTVLTSLAYMFGPASIITALKRVFAMFWGVIFGKLIFNETNFLKKILNVAILSVGVFIMNFQTFASNINWLKDIQTSLLKTDINGGTKIELKYYTIPDKLPEQLKKSDIFIGF